MPTTSEDVRTISNRLYALGALVLAKTGKRPWFGPQITINDDRCEITLYGHDTALCALCYAKGNTPIEALEAAELFADAMPDLATAQLHAHMRAVAACIDKARAAGIPDAYVTPLAATVAAISANLLPPPSAMAQP